MAYETTQRKRVHRSLKKIFAFVVFNIYLHENKKIECTT